MRAALFTLGGQTGCRACLGRLAGNRSASANPTGRGCRIISVTDFTGRHTARVLFDPVRLHQLVNSLRVVQGPRPKLNEAT